MWKIITYNHYDFIYYIFVEYLLAFLFYKLLQLSCSGCDMFMLKGQSVSLQNIHRHPLLFNEAIIT